MTFFLYGAAIGIVCYILVVASQIIYRYVQLKRMILEFVIKLIIIF